MKSAESSPRSTRNRERRFWNQGRLGSSAGRSVREFASSLSYTRDCVCAHRGGPLTTALTPSEQSGLT